MLLKPRAAVAMEGDVDGDGFQYANSVIVSAIDDMEDIDGEGGDDAA